MIITVAKSDEEVRRALEPYRDIVVIGCGTCATICRTGGEDQVKEMVEKLVGWGKNVLASMVVESPCDVRIDKRDLRRIEDEVEKADALLVMSCGVGVQAVGEASGKKVLAALDTVFLGEVEHIGRFLERCRECGMCVLNETEGLCPMVLCAKGLMNGPCEDMINGKCGVIENDVDCVWVKVWERMKNEGREDAFLRVNPPLDRSVKVGAMKVTW
ncbi:MAG: methylenetetrahydrofolate reductase C-terminal domain-containing protein [Candidatus Jordarchaeales archaeon]|nr:methylenetetrahydrofolate reductase C-terminal domain-containing protein [Candidatus Jordarchaeia archaeon]